MQNNKEYPNHILEGLKMLSDKVVGHSPIQIPAFIGDKVSSTFIEEQIETKIQTASKEYTKYIEDTLRNQCRPYESLIEEMSYSELEAFNWIYFMAYDIERGLDLGQAPHLHFNYSKSFILWERKIQRRVEMQYQKLSNQEINVQNMVLPFERTYWVIPGKLLAGEIPSAREEETRKTKVQNLIKMGFDTIINLMEPDETTFSGELLVDYTPYLHKYSKSRKKKVTVNHFPIKDLSITSPERMKQTIAHIFNEIEAGKKVYVHCWGGVGRTGMVIGCFLLEQKMATTENVIETIAYLKRTTSIADRRSPETDEQMDFVLDWPILRSEL